MDRPTAEDFERAADVWRVILATNPASAVARVGLHLLRERELMREVVKALRRPHRIGLNVALDRLDAFDREEEEGADAP